MPNWWIGVTAPSFGDDSLSCRRMELREELGRPFECDLYLNSDKPDVKFGDVLGKEITVSFGLDDSERKLHGYVCALAQLPDDTRRAVYQATVRPWLWFLSRSSNCRIFQDKTVPDIVKAVFRDHGFTDLTDRLAGEYRKREFCVQYRESDLDFVSRLMEDEGIYYYFTHEASGHKLVLADDHSSHSEVAGSETIPYFPPGNADRRERSHIFGLRIVHSVQPGAVVLNAYDFTRPKADLLVKRELPKEHAHAKYETYEYLDHYRVRGDGEHYVAARMEELASGHERIHMDANVRELGAGDLFTLEEYPREDQNRKYLIVAARYSLAAGGAGVDPYSCQFEVVPAAEPFRVASITPRVRMPGPQTAVVVGKSGEEIWTDEYGRVKVQFMWDRDGKSDENSSCWVRVAQIWAGNTFGGFQIPRIGEEVIVDFLGGDPDYPIIVGRVYNKDNAVPYPLPGEQTKSGIKTRSTKKGTAENFNELRFEDKKGDEEIYFHAEKNFNRVVENDDSLKVGFEKKDKGDQKIEVYNDQTLTIGAGSKGGSQTIVVYKDRTAEMKTGNDTITITQGNHKTEITAGKSETSAMQSIELKVGGNSIKIDQSGITLKGIKISVEGSATAEVKSPMTKVNGDGMVMIQGGLVKIN